MKTKRITIADVAERAGVSRQTVSRVMNHKGEITEETRQRVEAAINTLGYHPHAGARGMTQRRAYILGIVIPYAANYFFSDLHLTQFICGVDDIAGQREVSLLLSTALTHTEPAKIEELSAYKRLNNAVYMDGVLVIETVASRVGTQLLQSQGYPYVLLGYPAPGSSDYAVHADDAVGARQATMHLLSLGHRCIGVIGGTDQMPTAFEERLAGYRMALGDHNLPFDPVYLVRGDLTLTSGYHAAAQLMALPTPPTAIFALNDAMALGAWQYLQAQGWQIPEQVSLVGFDDIPMATTQSLTTVRQPTLEMGHQAARLIFELIEEHAMPTRAITLPTELVVRGSTGVVKSRP